MLKLSGCLRGLGMALLCAVVASPAWAQSLLDQSLPIYRPVDKLQGSVRLAGSSALGIQAEVWGDTFSLYYPNVTLEIDAKGSGMAIAALIKNEADIGMMSRDIRENEVAAIEKFMGKKPIQLTPSLERLAVYVHKDNPIKGLSLQQLDAIFSTTMKAKNDKPIRTWGDLGLTGEWANAPINAHCRNVASGTRGYFDAAVLRGGEVRDSVTEQPGNLDVVKAVATDKFAIGYAGLEFRNPTVRPVALSVLNGEEFVDIDGFLENGGRYPLLRSLHIIVARREGQKLTDVEKEFLKYVFSLQGQEDVIKAGFLPITSKTAAGSLSQVGLQGIQ